MFNCCFVVDLPLLDKNTGERVYSTIAEIGFDPGLQPDDEVTVNGAAFVKTQHRESGIRRPNSVPTYDFRAKVLKREKVLDIAVETASGVVDTVTLLIYLEIADKEYIPEIVKFLTEKFPESYQSAI